jgi:hypothetical protein
MHTKELVRRFSSMFCILAMLGSFVGVTMQVAPAEAAAPVGSVDQNDNTTIRGWAKDSDYSGSIYVHIYVDGTLFDAVLANLSRPDVGGNYGFDYIHPSFGSGSHSVVVYAIGVDSSGTPDGNNPALGWTAGVNSTVTGNCSSYATYSLVWCNAVGSYWGNRQTDTMRVFNNNVMAGIDMSYGGSITQLYSNDRSTNLIEQHGGGFVQLSLYGTNITATTSPCNGTTNTSSVNPIEAIGAGCLWQTAGGTDLASNNVTVSGTVGGSTTSWWSQKTNPYMFNRQDMGPWPGLTFSHTVERSGSDGYIKISYKVTNGTSLTTSDVTDQEIPAIHTIQGIDKKVYYATSAGTLITVTLVPTTTPTGVNLSGTQHWWSICDSGTKCVTTAVTGTVATKFSYMAKLDATLCGASACGGYAPVLGSFAIAANLSKTWTVYMFPYRYDVLVNGVSVRTKINSLLNP